MSTFTAPTVKIGDKVTTAIGYGAMGLGGAFYGKADSDEDRFKVLDHIYSLGERHIDTANIYGDSEVLIGKWLALHPTYRSSIFLATKFGFDASDWAIRADPEFVHSEFEVSMGKLGEGVGGYVDLYYLHRPDPKVPIEVTVGAMAELVKSGRVKYLGLSECSSETIRRAHKVHPITAVQVEYSPFEIVIETGGVFDTCKELGITVVAYSPTARGLLTGRFSGPQDFADDDFRKTIPKFSAENFPLTLTLIQTLQKIGKAHNATAAQVSIAWVLAQGALPIPGSKQLKYAEENLKASDVKLSVEEVKEIRTVAEEIEKKNSGARYPGSFQGQLFADTPALEGWKGRE